MDFALTDRINMQREYIAEAIAKQLLKKLQEKKPEIPELNTSRVLSFPIVFDWLEDETLAQLVVHGFYTHLYSYL
jgi:hypothetical protein